MSHSFDEIYAEYHNKVLSYVRARVHDPHEAEDITSDVFIKVMQAYENYDSEKATATLPGSPRALIPAKFKAEKK